MVELPVTLPTVVDFETEPILPRPHYPPRPVSVSVWEHGKKPEFWAFGHPSGNNCTKAEVRSRLRDVWRGSAGVLCHEAKFDLDVAEVHLGLRPPPWHRIYDTIFDLFLADPNAPALDLKGAAETYLDWPQDDQDELRAWILANVPGAKRRPSKWAAHMAKLPGELAAKRAVGDVRRTKALFKLFHVPSEAYDRERRALFTLLAMERRGVPIDEARLDADERAGQRSLDRIDRWLRKRLDAPDLEVQKREQLADAIEEAGLVDEWLLTAPSKTHPDGVRKTGWESLQAVDCKDPFVVGALRYRGVLKAQLDTTRTWLRQGSARVYLSLNQVRSVTALKGKQVGARTGRLSATPNLLNVSGEPKRLATTPRAFARAVQHGDAILVPLRGLVMLDNRAAVKAPRGRMLGDQDYSQQELRILAHAVPDGPLAIQYRKDAHTDAHGWVSDFITPVTGRRWPKRHVKGVNFGVLYGEGLDLLSSKLNIPRGDAQTIRTACRNALGAGALSEQFKAQGYVDTIGGRHCPVEPPSLVNGVLRNWDYKLLNTYIQGSAADQMKEAFIAIEELGIVELLLSIYDEVLWEAPSKGVKKLLAPVAEAMREAMSLSVPMIVDGAVGKTWRDAK